MGGLSCNMAGFRRLEIPVKSCRISKSDLQFYNGCKMLKQVQHDKFYSKIASPLVGEAEFQHEERVLEIQVRGNLRVANLLDPSPAFVVHCVHTTAASPTRGEAVILLKSGTCGKSQIPLIK